MVNTIESCTKDHPRDAFPVKGMGNQDPLSWGRGKRLGILVSVKSALYEALHYEICCGVFILEAFATASNLRHGEDLRILADTISNSFPYVNFFFQYGNFFFREDLSTMPKVLNRLFLVSRVHANSLVRCMVP